jgi:hypothetical protein
MAIPIADVSCDVQELIVKLVSKILANRKQNPQSDITEIEKQINEIIYRIYDLTDAEIKTIEQSI